ncbi:MAG TPA: CBS domain-containing protein [Alphaproteobacteria bacterium]
MRAKDVMTTRVVSVAPDVTVKEIASALLSHRISAVPVVDQDGRLVGIVSEGDLIRRAETGTAPSPRSWWLDFVTPAEDLARRYVKAHGRRARDVMTKNVVTVKEDAPLAEVAELLETRHIKRVPVLRDGKLVGIVSRANLVQGLATMRSPEPSAAPSDETMRQRILAELEREHWSGIGTTNVTVAKGVVEFWGLVDSNDIKEATRVAAENVPGVKQVIDRRVVSKIPVGAY